MLYFGCTQHLGLAEDVLDHRLNSRTVYMNPIFRFLYWNMNYHVEHHLFPLIPYHALPKLHAAIKADCPSPIRTPSPPIARSSRRWSRQLRDPTYYVRRELPGGARSAHPFGAAPASGEGLSGGSGPMSETWIDAGAADRISPEDVAPFEHQGRQYALYRTADDRYFATDGLCTHEQVELADGFVSGHDHRMPDAQRTVRLHHRRGEGRARLRQSRDLSGKGRGRQAVRQARLTAEPEGVGRAVVLTAFCVGWAAGRGEETR